MSFGDWNGDGDVSVGEALGTAALLSGIAGSGGSGDPGDGEPPRGGGGGGCGCMGCLPFIAGVLVAYFLVEIIFWGW
ncbi:MAG: hypothetical protein PUD96_05050 [Coriobacteriaceae bacterium]|nr:hypothetical protein [Coriobacteriaceae bacterium]